MYSGKWCAEYEGPGVSAAAADVVCGGGDGGDICGAGLLCICWIRPKHVHKLTTLLPRDYCLISGNGTMNLLIETK